MLDIKEYQKSLLSYSDDLLIQQHSALLELREQMWYSSQYSEGEERERCLDQYEEARQQVKALENEISFRHINF